jgi:hypothetical protein
MRCEKNCEKSRPTLKNVWHVCVYMFLQAQRLPLKESNPTEFLATPPISFCHCAPFCVDIQHQHWWSWARVQSQWEHLVVTMDRRQYAPKRDDDVGVKNDVRFHLLLLILFLEQHHHDDAAGWVWLIVVVFLVPFPTLWPNGNTSCRDSGVGVWLKV